MFVHCIVFVFIIYFQIGKVYSMLDGIQSLCWLIDVIVYNWLLWPVALSPAVSFPGLPYLVNSGIMVVPFAILLYSPDLFIT